MKAPATTTALPSDSLLLSADIRRIEAEHADIDLMRRAGKAAADFLVARTLPDARIVLLAGPGNNGGDAFACAAELKASGFSPTVVFIGAPARLPADAAEARLRALDLGVPVADSAAALADADWIIDGLFGIGLTRPLRADYGALVEAISSGRAAGASVLALDVPSGIDADTGALVGKVAVAADHTLTFIARKPGLLTGPALDYVGELHLASLGLDLSGATSTITAFGLSDARALMRPARANAHKGTHGTLTIVGGTTGMLGAALLASRAAMRTGAGKVRVAWLADPHPQVDPLMPEVMMRAATASGALDDCTALAAGCGMGQSVAAKRLLSTALKRDLPLLLDADALNLIATSKSLQAQVVSRTSVTVITPHPTEAARVLGCATVDVQQNRLRAARQLAEKFHCVAVLKGAGTVVDDGHHATINATGNPLLATAGTGDVLAGMIGALLARGYSAADAARIGVALHGSAADALAAKDVKRAVASDVIAELANL